MKPREPLATNGKTTYIYEDNGLMITHKIRLSDTKFIDIKIHMDEFEKPIQIDVANETVSPGTDAPSVWTNAQQWAYGFMSDPNIDQDLVYARPGAPARQEIGADTALDQMVAKCLS